MPGSAGSRIPRWSPTSRTALAEATVDALEAGFARSGTRFEIDRYAGAGHAFLNRTRPEAYSEAASEAAWFRVVPFMRDALEGRAPR